MNVCIYRIPKKISIIGTLPSYCPKCKKPIKAYDNIPLLGFLLLKGRCRSCSTKISLRYPLVEFITGLLFVIFFLKFGLEKIYFFYIIMVGYMVVLAFIDIDKRIVPDGIILFMIISGMFFGMFNLNPAVSIFEGIIGGIAAGLVLLALSFFSNGMIGEGDIKLFAALGLCYGFREITAIMSYAFIIGGIYSAVLLIKLLVAGKYKYKSTTVAFVPFIAAAVVLRAIIH